MTAVWWLVMELDIDLLLRGPQIMKGVTLMRECFQFDGILSVWHSKTSPWKDYIFLDFSLLHSICQADASQVISEEPDPKPPRASPLSLGNRYTGVGLHLMHSGFHQNTIDTFFFSCGEQLYKHSMSVCLSVCLSHFVYALPGAILLGSWWNLVGAHLGLRSRPSSFVGDVAR